MSTVVKPGPQLPPQGEANARAGLLPRRDTTPRRQLRRFAWLSATSALTILLLAGASLYVILREHVVAEARRNSVAVATAMFEHEQNELLRILPDGTATVEVIPDHFDALDQRMRAFLRAFGVVKVKVYDMARTIVYSTDAGIIGVVDRDNARLERVLRTGEADAKLVHKDAIPDLQHRERFDVDVVETYTAIRAGPAIVGSFEVYVDVTPAYDALRTVVRNATFVLLAVLAVVFGLLFGQMRNGMTRLAVVQSRLRDLATIDALTRLWNRRQLYARIDEEYSRLARVRLAGEPVVPIAFIMADVDHFKQVNDVHGHLVGDRVLREIARRLRLALRPYDVIGRFGGEEFLAMLPRTDLVEVASVAERMRQLIADAPIDVGGVSLPITTSFGVTVSFGGGDDVNFAVDRADQALYRAKQGGRNRVEALAPQDDRPQSP